MPEEKDPKDLEAEVEKRVSAGIQAKLDSGEYVPKTALEGMFTKAEVDVMIKDENIKVSREKTIASIGADEATTGEWAILATNKAIYPYDEEGEKKFSAAVDR